MPEFRMPQTAAEWAAVEPNKTDERIRLAWASDTNGRSYPVLIAVSRLLERERCVKALAGWFGTQGGFSDDAAATDRDFAEARRILDAPLPAPWEGDKA